MLSEQELAVILTDRTKWISGDIAWRADQSHLPAQRFRCDVYSEPAWPLFIEGWWNPSTENCPTR